MYPCVNYIYTQICTYISAYIVYIYANQYLHSSIYIYVYIYTSIHHVYVLTTSIHYVHICLTETIQRYIKMYIIYIGIEYKPKHIISYYGIFRAHEQCSYMANIDTLLRPRTENDTLIPMDQNGNGQIIVSFATTYLYIMNMYEHCTT